jgi:hypothetical protein
MFSYRAFDPSVAHPARAYNAWLGDLTFIRVVGSLAL